MEITITSAKGLKKTSSALFSYQIKPFVTLTTTLPPSPCTTISISNANKNCHVYKTRVDDQGRANPTWGDKFQLPNIDASFFFYQRYYSCIYLQVHTKSFLVGNSLLGWCGIPAADILDGTLPAGAVRHLSYRLRKKDGSRGNGVVNVAVKLQGRLLDPVIQPAQRIRSSDRNGQQLPEMGGSGYQVTGVPVRMPPAVSGGDYPTSYYSQLYA